MTWKENSNSDWFRAVESMVTDSVLFFRNRGHRHDIAIEQTALALGLSRRKTRSIFYQEPVAATAEEYRAIRLAFIRHLAFQEDDLARRSEAARLRRHQMNLELE